MTSLRLTPDHDTDLAVASTAAALVGGSRPPSTITACSTS